MKVTLSTLSSLKARGQKAVFVTAYDYPTATFAERAGVDMILIGDSAAMTMMGLPTTVSIGMTEMLVFVRSVCKAVKPVGRAFVVGDLPFLSYQTSDREAVRNAGAFVTAGCDAVKCEGGARIARRVRTMVDAGINVMGHLGLTPQNLGQLSGFRVQGKSLDACQRIVDDARALEQAGAFSILLEAMPSEAAGYIRAHLNIPVYGIGAGNQLDGQLLISNDMLGNFVGDISPRFAKQYASVGAVIESAFTEYAREVRAELFPAPEHCYAIDGDSEAELRQARASRELSQGRATNTANTAKTATTASSATAATSQQTTTRGIQ
jgi:3-methyl-2-oxobutanoate hydroxymethyltransferase